METWFGSNKAARKEAPVSRRIVVGVSGRPSTLVAVDWSVDYATTHDGLGIELVHVVEDSWGFIPMDVRDEVVAQAQTQLDDHIARTRLLAPGVTVNGIVLEGPSIGRLVEQADDAELLVVATHPLRRFGNQVFSTGAAQIAARAHCPVAVIPDLRTPRGRKPAAEPVAVHPQHPYRSAVVVGVDGSSTSDLAVQFAADEAVRRNLALVMVYSWRVPPSMVAADMETGWLHEPTPADGRVLAEAVAGLAEQHPGLEIVQEMTASSPIDALRDAASGAHLLVVGTHGRQGISRFWLGSVSHQILLAMPCPVVVVRPPSREV
jgi:nucleotide-binding universal stress UspA family protein